MLQIRWIKKKKEEEKGRGGREEKGKEAGAEKKEKEKEKQHSNKENKKGWKLLLWGTWPFLPLRLSLSLWLRKSRFEDADQDLTP